MRERGKANSLTTFSNWFWTTIVGAIFPMASTASLAGCFGFFAGVVFLSLFVSEHGSLLVLWDVPYSHFLSSLFLLL